MAPGENTQINFQKLNKTLSWFLATALLIGAGWVFNSALDDLKIMEEKIDSNLKFIITRIDESEGRIIARLNKDIK